MGSRGAWLVYGLVGVASLGQTAIVPLLPHYAERYGLGSAQTGALLAAAGVAMIAVALPTGLAGDRLHAGRLTLAGGALVAVASLGQALAGSFAELLAWRTLFGVGFAVIWTAGPAWLAQATRADEERAGRCGAGATPSRGGEARVGAISTCGAIGVVVGPALSGVLAEQVGVGAPFVAAAVAAAVLTALATRLAEPDVARPEAGLRPSLSSIARTASRRPALLSGAAALALSGAVTGIVQLLVPVALRAEGISTAAIGLTFSAAAGVYIATSAGVLLLGARAVTLRMLGMAAAGSAVALSPAAMSASSVAVVIALLVYSAPRATLSTIVYPLAARDSARAGLGESGVLGMLNTIWAAATVVGPLAAGALSAALGTHAVFVVVLAGAALAAAWIARPQVCHARAQAVR